MGNDSPNERLISLDVFRGLTIAGMILVNNPGTWSAVYGPFLHAEWHGVTPTDYIFPFFLFIVGVAIPIAFGKRIASGKTKGLYERIIRRSVLIFAVGLVMSAIPFFNFSETQIPFALKVLIFLAYSAALFLYLANKGLHALIVALAAAFVVFGFWFAGYLVVPYNLGNMRIPGVLQRIAVCYLVVSILYLNTNWKQQSAITVVLLLAYWILMTIIPVPGCEITTIDDKACNLAAWIDRVVLTENHIWRAGKVFDPEGILSTIPAIATTLTGLLTGEWLLKGKNHSPSPAIEKASGMFFAGTILLAIGWTWSLVFPLNKSLWTSSYVVYTSGLALLTLGSCYFLIDIKGYKRWAKPFVIFGVNALGLFVFSGIFARLLGLIKFAGVEGKDVSLQQWIFSTLFLPILSPKNASLAFAVAFLLAWFFLMWLLYRRRMFLKV